MRITWIDRSAFEKEETKIMNQLILHVTLIGYYIIHMNHCVDKL